MNARRWTMLAGSLLCLILPLTGSDAAGALTPAGGGWYWQNPQPVRVGDLEDLFFADATTVYAVGMGHGLGRSTDGGATWQLMAEPPGEGLSFSDANDGWALSGLNLGEQSLWHTSDGAVTWTEVKVPATMAIRSIDFVSPTAGYAIGHPIDPPDSYHGPPTLYSTIDGGTTWQSRALPSDAVGQRLQFIDASNGWIAVGDGRVAATHDGGQTWSYVQSPASGDSYWQEDIRMQFADADNGVVFFGVDDPGYAEEIAAVVTHDGGATWQRTLVPGVVLDGVAMADAEHLIAFGRDAMTVAGVYGVSSDGGATWQTRHLSPIQYRWSVTSGPTGLTCACGPSMILTSGDFGASWRPSWGGFVGSLTDVATQGSSAWATGSRLDADGPFFIDLLLALSERWDWRPEAGLLLHAPDGVTWHAEAVPEGVSFNQLAFGSPTKGWAVGSGDWESSGDFAGIWTTSDAGTNWTRQREPYTDAGIYDICAVDADHAWAVTPRAVLRTSDGGASWTKTKLPGRPGLERVVFIDAQRGWVAGDSEKGGPVLFSTGDGGATWTKRSFLDKTGDMQSIAFSDAQHGWALLAMDEWTCRLLRTSDGGASWTDVAAPEECSLFDIAFVSHERGLAVGDSVYETLDGGRTWQKLTTGSAEGDIENAPLFAVAASDATHTWAVGGGGAILSPVDTTADTAPPATLDDFDRGWHNAAVTIRLTAGDMRGSGLLRTEYRVDGETDWRAGDACTFGAPLSGIGDGIHYLAYRSIDNAGNIESATVRCVPIDTRPPRAVGLRATPRVHRGRRVTVTCRMVDSLSPTTIMSIEVSRREHVVKRLRWRTFRTGPVRRLHFKAPRRLGTYDVVILSKDLAGNEGWDWTSFKVVKKRTTSGQASAPGPIPQLGAWSPLAARLMAE